MRWAWLIKKNHHVPVRFPSRGRSFLPATSGKKANAFLKPKRHERKGGVPVLANQRLCRRRADIGGEQRKAEIARLASRDGPAALPLLPPAAACLIS